MAIELSGTTIMLLKKLKQQGLDEDSVVGMTLVLEREGEKAQQQMLSWLGKNPQANEEDVFAQQFEIMGWEIDDDSDDDCDDVLA